jgi:integrase
LGLQAGIRPDVMSKRVGHATVAFTLQTYAHALPAHEAEAADKVALLVFGEDIG